MKNCDYCGGPWHHGAKITELDNGEAVLFFACNKCATKMLNGDTEPDPHVQSTVEMIKTAEELLDMITGLPASPPQPKLPTKAPCPDCGLSLEELFKVGKFGCEHCYEHYREELVPITKAHHDGHTTHVGKRPKNRHVPKTAEERKKLLLLKKAKAVELENYEEAAKIVEQINRLDADADEPAS